MCKCRDTGTKRCRVLYSTPDSWSIHLKGQNKPERLAIRRELSRCVVEVEDV